MNYGPLHSLVRTLQRHAWKQGKRFVVAAVTLCVLLAPSLAHAHPGHPGGDAAHLGGPMVPILGGIAIGVIVGLWDKARNRQWAPLPAFAMAGDGTLPESTPEAEPELTATQRAWFEANCPSYYTVRIPYALVGATEWHPTEDTGPFSVLTRGAFPTLTEACAWADSKLNHTAYSVVFVERVLTGNRFEGDKLTTVYTSGVQS